MKSVDRLGAARTLLFVPANRPERFAKALTSGADSVVLDLEDSVPAAEKASARTLILEASRALESATVPVVVRINALGTPEADSDLACLARLGSLAGVMVPKAESAGSLAK